MSGEKAMSGEVCCGVHHMHHTMKRAWLLKRDPDEKMRGGSVRLTVYR